MQEQTTKTTTEISACGAYKEDWLNEWGYISGTPDAEAAWLHKLKLDESVSAIRNPNKPHNRMVELPSYQSPITGKWIDGRAARRNDLAASGCVEYEPGMKEDQEKRHAAEDAALDNKVGEIVEQEIYAMPTEKREKLGAELENNEVEVKRI